MKVTELKDWNKLTPEEQARVREVYSVDEEDNLPEAITKTMAQEPPKESQQTETVVVHADKVIVNEKEGGSQ